MPLKSPGNLKPYTDRGWNGLSENLTEQVLFGHPSSCPCCRNLPNDGGTKIGELLLANGSGESLFTGAAASNQTLADYLRSGFWTDFSSSARKFNLSSSGTYAKNGVITYNATAILRLL